MRVPYVFAAALCFIMASVEVTAQERLSASGVEVLVGARVDQETITLTVISSGCTERDDFTFKVQETEVGPAVTVLRVKPDMCKRMPSVKDITLMLQELDIRPGQQIAIVNRFDGSLISH